MQASAVIKREKEEISVTRSETARGEGKKGGKENKWFVNLKMSHAWEAVHTSRGKRKMGKRQTIVPAETSIQKTSRGLRLVCRGYQEEQCRESWPRSDGMVGRVGRRGDRTAVFRKQNCLFGKKKWGEEGPAKRRDKKNKKNQQKGELGARNTDIPNNCIFV